MEGERFIVVIEGRSISVGKQMEEKMKYFEEWRALSQPGANLCPINSVLHLQEWDIIVEILQELGYQLPEIPRVRSSRAEDCIGPYLAQRFQALSMSQLNRLYVAVRYLKVEGLRMALASFLASKVYLSDDPASLSDCLERNKVNVSLSAEVKKGYMSEYAFLNK